MSEASYIQRRNRPLHVYALLYLAFLYIPVLILPLFSFNDSIFIAFPLRGFTTSWYEQLFANEPLFAALMNRRQPLRRAKPWTPAATVSSRRFSR